MGLKHFFQRRRLQRQREQAAIEIDLEAGVLQRCPICHEVYDRQQLKDLGPAIELAEKAFDRHDPRVALFGDDRQALLALLDKARDAVPFACACDERG